jgi:hypothetical protein
MRDAPVNERLKSNFNHEQYGVFAYHGDQIYALHNFREKAYLPGVANSTESLT